MLEAWGQERSNGGMTGKDPLSLPSSLQRPSFSARHLFARSLRGTITGRILVVGQSVCL